MNSMARSAVIACCGLASVSAQDLFFDPLAALFDRPPPRENEGIHSHMVRSATSDDGLT